MGLAGHAKAHSRASMVGIRTTHHIIGPLAQKEGGVGSYIRLATIDIGYAVVSCRLCKSGPMMFPLHPLYSNVLAITHPHASL